MGRPLNSFVSVFDDDVTKEKGIGITGFRNASDPGRAAPPPDRAVRAKTGQRTSATPRMSGSSTPSSPRPGLRSGVSQGGTGLGSTQSPRTVPEGTGVSGGPDPRLAERARRRPILRSSTVETARPILSPGVPQMDPQALLREQLILALLGGGF